MEKRTKSRFSAEQNTPIVLDMPSGSDMSNIGEVLEEKLHHTEALPLEMNNVSDNEEEEADKSETDTEEQTSGTGYNTQGRTYRWRKKHPPTYPTQVYESSFSHVPDNVAQRTPFKYFKQFWDDEITNMLVKQTNFHSVEKSGVNISTDEDGIEKLVAVQMLMSIVTMPRYEMYWSEATRYEPVASKGTKSCENFCI